MRHWLEGQGLERYTANFEKHAVSDDILPSLTRDDLGEMGVTAVGDRRRLLEAIGELREGAPAAGAPKEGRPRS